MKTFFFEESEKFQKRFYIYEKCNKRNHVFSNSRSSKDIMSFSQNISALISLHKPHIRS